MSLLLLLVYIAPVQADYLREEKVAQPVVF
jgi:hypothetical protein